MLKTTVAAAAILALSAAPALAKEPLFWNLTVNTINSVVLSAPGKNAWGPEQIVNDKDKTVDPDERLKITGTADGVYDVKFKDVKGRSCLVPNVAVVAGQIFSIDEKQLGKACTP